MVDLRRIASIAIADLCWALTRTGSLILHGSNFPEPLSRLEPRKANDSIKASGNQVALYATTDADEALMCSVLNRSYLQSKLKSFGFGNNFSTGKRVFKVTENLYQLFEEGDPNVCTDGYIYVLDKSRFSKANDTLTEYYSLVSQTPLLILQVPQKLSKYLFVIKSNAGADTVIKFAPSELALVERRHVSGRDDTPEERTVR